MEVDDSTKNLMFSMKFKPDITTLCWLIIVPYVFIDAISGFFAQEIGVNIKLSLVLKITLLFLSLLCLIRWKSKYLFFVSFISIHIIISLYYSVMQNGQEALVNELPFAMKIIMTIVMYVFAKEYSMRDPITFIKYSRMSLNFGFWVVIVNVLFGYFGIGYYTYPNSDIGYKGFFVAGNELSALFIVLSCFKLHDVWNLNNRKQYLFFSLLVLFIGISIGTKAGILFSVFAVFAIPFFNLRQKVLSLKSLIILLCLCLVLMSGLILIYHWIETLPIGQRIFYNLSKYGVLGLIFSGRDEWVLQVFERISDADGLVPLFLGYGSTELKLLIGKTSLEVDPIDMFVYFGVIPAVLVFVWAVNIIIFNIKNLNRYYFAPSVLVANVALLLFACIAGHVWTSGMLGIAWALLNGLAVSKSALLHLKN
ncbi:MAG: O-antigen ligase family protein [Colwellia sp.]|nr:O-antigen ligase family protein [Colwellia sp.]